MYNEIQPAVQHIEPLFHLPSCFHLDSSNTLKNMSSMLHTLFCLLIFLTPTSHCPPFVLISIYLYFQIDAPRDSPFHRAIPSYQTFRYSCFFFLAANQVFMIIITDGQFRQSIVQISFLDYVFHFNLFRIRYF